MTDAIRTRDLELYIMGAYDGDINELEQYLEQHADARAFVAEQAQLELELQQLASAAAFCCACDGIVRGDRCDHCGAATTAGGFTIELLLVKNAHGRLYLARDADGSRVALKELAFVQSPEPEAVAAFEREARFLRALEHPAIPRFVAAFQEGTGVHTRFYLAQEFIDGQPLDGRLADHWYDEQEIVDIAHQVLSVLVYLQKLSPMVVHRDIKPANLLRREDGTIAVVDFGAAYDQGATLGTTMTGTFGYMPLEQMAGEVGPTTDVYALGASLLHLLTREEPWKLLETAEVGAANVSSDMRRVLQTMVARAPAARYQSAADALRAVQAPSSLLLPAPQTRPPRRHRHRAWVAAAVCAAVALPGAATYMLAGDEADPPAINPIEAIALPQPTPPPAVDELDILFDRPNPATTTPFDRPIPATTAISINETDADLRQVLRRLAASAELNLIIPHTIRGKVSIQLTDVPANQAIEAVLESQQLWYTYDAEFRILRVGPRSSLRAEEIQALELDRMEAELGMTSEPRLPLGAPVDLDLDGAELHKVLRLLAAAGDTNLVIASELRGQVSLQLKGVPWNRALEAILRSQGLWYRYRTEGKVLRIAPQSLIRAERLEQLELHQLREEN